MKKIKLLLLIPIFILTLSCTKTNTGPQIVVNDKPLVEDSYNYNPKKSHNVFGVDKPKTEIQKPTRKEYTLDFRGMQLITIHRMEVRYPEETLEEINKMIDNGEIDAYNINFEPTRTRVIKEANKRILKSKGMK